MKVKTARGPAAATASLSTTQGQGEHYPWGLDQSRLKAKLDRSSRDHSSHEYHRVTNLQVLPSSQANPSLSSSTQESSVSPNGSRARSSKERREEMGLEFLNGLSTEEIERLVASKIACLPVYLPDIADKTRRCGTLNFCSKTKRTVRSN